MTDKIAEIRARHERDDCLRDGLYPGAHRDRATLLAEVERLNKDLLAQNGCCDGAAAQDAHVRREREEHRAEVERLREALRWYADPSNHFRVERRNPGDPDPALVVIEETPIMSDGGERARKALEGKP